MADMRSGRGRNVRVVLRLGEETEVVEAPDRIEELMRLVGRKARVSAFLYHDSKGDQTLFSDQETYQDILHEAQESPIPLSIVPSSSPRPPHHPELSIPSTEWSKYLLHPGLPAEDSLDDSDLSWKCHLCGSAMAVSLAECPNCEGLSWPYWPRFTAQIAYEMTLQENWKYAGERLISGKLEGVSGSQWECKFCRVVNPLNRSVCAACYRTNFALKMKETCGDSLELAQPHAHCLETEEAESQINDLQPIQAVDSDKESDIATKRAETEASAGLLACPNCKGRVSLSGNCVNCAQDGRSVRIISAQSEENSPRRGIEEEVSPPLSWRPPLPQFTGNERLDARCRICPRTPEPGSKFCKDCLSTSDLSQSFSKSSLSHWSCLKCGFRQNKEWNVICSQCFAPSSPQRVSPVPSKRVTTQGGPVWTCRYCRAGNYISYPLCRSCKRHNEPETASVSVPSREKKWAAEDTNWTCRWCWHRNLRVQITCSRCYRPKGAFSSSQITSQHSSANPTPRASLTPGEGWPCPGCGLPLPISSPLCQVCRVSRSSSGTFRFASK